MAKQDIFDAIDYVTKKYKTDKDNVFLLGLSGGVFIVAECDNPRFITTLSDKNVQHSSDGKRALFYRPYHLVGIEAPISIMKAVLNNEATAEPLENPVAEVIAIAKRDLLPGERLDGIGGKTVRGEIEVIKIVTLGDYLPLCMAENVTLKAAVPKGTPLSYSMLKNPGDDFMWRLKTGKLG